MRILHCLENTSFPRVNLDPHNHACQSSFSTSMILFKYFKKQSLPTSNKAELPDAARTILELRLELCVVGLWRQESVRQ